MHPLLTRASHLALYLSAWVPLALLLAALLALPGTLSWRQALVVGVPLAVVYAFVCLGAHYVCRAVPARGTPLARLAFTQLGAATVSALLWVAAADRWVAVLARWAALAPPPQARWQVVPVFFGFGLLLFLLASALHYVLAAVEASQRAETEALRLELLSREAELRALRAQVHPHFLFNSLNSISALITRDPPEARRACGLLADLLRGSLSLGGRESVPLIAEVRLVERLLALEQIRFGKRLQSAIEVEAAAEAVLIPPLILQPLVENAVKHGIAGLLEGGVVQLTAGLAEGVLTIVVDNPRDPESPPRPGAGIGLDSVRRRLKAAFGPGRLLEITEEPTRFRATLRLPVLPAGGA
jgi:hypothetical protein